MSAEQPVAVVIAAGGDGNRIGGNKPSRLLGGIPLIARALNFAHLLSDNVAVAIRRDTQITLPPDIPLLVDAEANGGPLSALASALDWAAESGKRHVLMIGCDTPFLPHDLLHRLSAIGSDTVAMAKSGDRLHPACALWPVTARAALDDDAVTGRRSLIGFAETVGYWPVEWPALPFDPFFNINTPDDLARAEAHLAKQDRR